MEKPNITEGPWVSKDGICISEVNGLVADCEIVELTEVRRSEKENNANAQAISAVPEMIDALIEAYELVLHQRIFEDDENMSKTLEHKANIIESALKKAGVTL